MEDQKKKAAISWRKEWLPWGIALVTFLLFSLFIYENRSIFIVPKEDITHMVVNQGERNDTVGEITNNMVISQSFTSNTDTFNRVQIPFATYNRQNEGILVIELREAKSHKVVFKKEINVHDLTEGDFTNIDLGQIKSSKGMKYEIQFRSQGLQSGKSVTIWSNNKNVYPSGKLTIDGKVQKGDLQFKVLNISKKPLLSKVQFVFIGSFLLLLFLLSLFALSKFRTEVHKAFLVTAIPICLAMVVIIPPFDQLDELEHYYRSFEVSEGNFTNHVTKDGIGNYIPVGLIDTASAVRFISQDGYKYSLVKEAFGIKVDPEKRVLKRNYASSYPPTLYIPQSLGMIIGRYLFDSPLMMMFLGRIFNMIAYLTIVYFALKIVPIKKKFFYIFALLPMSIISSASLSADPITNAASLLFVAYIFNLAYGKIEKIKKKHLVTASAIGIFVALSKIVYIPLILLFLIIPIKKFKSQKDYWLKFLLVFMVCVLPFIIWNLVNLSNMSVPDLRVHPNVSPKGQVLFILTHPIHYIKIIVDTIFTFGFSQFIQLIGAVATNYMFQSPAIVIYSYIFLLIFFAVTNDEVDLRVNIREIDKPLYIFISFLVFILVYTALYVGFSDVGAPTIDGIQGRYFIPFASLVFLSMSNKKIVNVGNGLNFLIMIIVHCLMYTLLFQYLIYVNT